MTKRVRQPDGWRNLRTSTTRRVGAFQSQFSTGLLGLTGGFVVGNFSGSYLGWFRSAGIWDGTILTATIVGFEGFNYLSTRACVVNSDRVERTVTSTRLGLLLGAFTDAFKVGS